MVKMVFELVGEGKGPQIVDWLSLTGRDRSQQAAGKAAKRKPEDDKDDEDMEGLDAPAAAGAEPTKPGGRTKDIYGDIISKWTNICQHEGTNYADVGLPPGIPEPKKKAVCTGEPRLIDVYCLQPNHERGWASACELKCTFVTG